MFAILRGANGRRHEVDFLNDPVSVDVAMSATVIQITMTADDDTNPATPPTGSSYCPERAMSVESRRVEATSRASLKTMQF